MSWFFIALFPPALWSVVNHIDKYLVSKYFKGGGAGSLVIFSSLVGFLTLPFILLLQPNILSIGFLNASLIIINGAIYILGLIPYFHAMQKDEASVVVPLFQTIPVFSYGLAYFVLGETLTTLQIFASLLVIIGAVLISLDIDQKKPRLKKEVFGLMFLASFTGALNSLIFKFVAIKESFWVTSFWEYVGFAAIATLLLVCVKSYRKEFISVIQTNKIPIIGLNVLNEVVNVVAKVIMSFATMLAPLALVWVVNGFQPFFVFAYGVLLTLFFPHLGEEKLQKKYIFQKSTAILIMFIGTYLLNKT